MRDIKTFDLNLLRVLDALLEERSVSRAAARLNLTQSAVSGLLARLRADLADPLFIRQQRGMLPTERALAMAEPVKDVLARAARLLEPDEFDPGTSERVFSLAATDYVQQVLLAPLMGVMQTDAPLMRLSMIPTDPSRIERDLGLGRLDLWLTLPSEVSQTLRLRELYRERYVCAIRRDHPHTGRSMSLSRFCELGHIIVSPQGGGFTGATDEALAKVNRRRRVVVSASSFAAVPAMLPFTDFVAVLPERLVRGRADLRLFAPPIAIEGFTQVAAWHERHQSDRAHKWLRDSLAAVAVRMRT